MSLWFTLLFAASVLHAKTANAAGRIDRQIIAMQSAAQNAVDAVRKIRDTVRDRGLDDRERRG